MCLFEVLEPALEGPVEIANDSLHTVTPGPPRLLPYLVPESLQALSTDVAPTGFQPIAEKLNPRSWLPIVPYGGFIGVQL